MGDSSSLYNFPVRNAGNSYLKYIVFKSIKRWFVLPVYISIETNRKYLLLWCPERRTGVLPSILKTLQEVQGGIKSREWTTFINEQFLATKPPGFPTKCAWKQKHFLCCLTRMRTSSPTNKRVPLRILSHCLRPMIYQLGFWTPKWGKAYSNQANGKNVPPIGGNLYDPDSKHPSWEPKADFSQSFLFTNKRKKKFHWRLFYM